MTHPRWCSLVIQQLLPNHWLSLVHFSPLLSCKYLFSLSFIYLFCEFFLRLLTWAVTARKPSIFHFSTSFWLHNNKTVKPQIIGLEIHNFLCASFVTLNYKQAPSCLFGLNSAYSIISEKLCLKFIMCPLSFFLSYCHVIGYLKKMIKKRYYIWTRGSLSLSCLRIEFCPHELFF